MVMDTLNNESNISQTYKKAIDESNLLNSRDNLVSLIDGLYRLYEWGWINNKEYFLAQTRVVERIANQKNVENIEIPPVQPLEPVEQIT